MHYRYKYFYLTTKTYGRGWNLHLYPLVIHTPWFFLRIGSWR